MTEMDVVFFNNCYTAGLVKGRMLEVGSAKVQNVPNLCEIAKTLGPIETVGVDLSSHDGVDAVFDFGLTQETFQREWQLGKFSTVCVFNVLEHTFDPITVLSNALSCVEEGGALLVVTPAVWPIHSFPGDYNRLLPDWYQAFAALHNLKLMEEHFTWLSQFGIEAVNSSAEPSFPTFMSRGLNASKSKYWISRAVHKLFNTYGRSHWATHAAIGAVFSKSK